MQRLWHFTATVLTLTLVWSPPKPATAAGNDRILYVPSSSVPAKVSRSLVKVFAKRGRMASTNAYRRAARRRRLRPTSVRSLRRIATRSGVKLIITATMDRRHVLKLSYRNGRNAGRVLDGEYKLSNKNKLSKGNKVDILDDLNTVLGKKAKKKSKKKPKKKPRPDQVGQDDEEENVAEDDEDEDEDDEDEDDEDEDDEDEDDEDEDEDSDDEESALNAADHSLLSAEIYAGFGLGNRRINLPSLAGAANLSTSPFPAFHAGFFFGVEAKQPRRFIVGLATRFYTSAALQVNDLREDSSTRTVDARSQHLAAGAQFRFNLLKKERSPYMQLGAGYNFRFFSTDQAVTVPGYTLGGVYLRPGFFFPISSSPLRVAVIPDLAFVLQVGDQLRDLGVASTGVIVGGDIEMHYRLIRQLDLGFRFRESHALIGATEGERFSDIERYVMLLVTYNM